MLLVQVLTVQNEGNQIQVAPVCSILLFQFNKTRPPKKCYKTSFCFTSVRKNWQEYNDVWFMQKHLSKQENRSISKLSMIHFCCYDCGCSYAYMLVQSIDNVPKKITAKKSIDKLRFCVTICQQYLSELESEWCFCVTFAPKIQPSYGNWNDSETSFSSLSFGLLL